MCAEELLSKLKEQYLEKLRKCLGKIDDYKAQALCKTFDLLYDYLSLKHKEKIRQILCKYIKRIEEDSCSSILRRFLMDYIVQAFSRDSFRVIDVGCGWGRYLAQLYYDNHHLVGIDIDIISLKIVKKHLPNVDIVCCDCSRLPLRGRCADFVICIGVLHELGNKRTLAVSEIFRILKPAKITIIWDVCFPSLLHKVAYIIKENTKKIFRRKADLEPIPVFREVKRILSQYGHILFVDTFRKLFESTEIYLVVAVKGLQ